MKRCARRARQSAWALTLIVALADCGRAPASPPPSNAVAVTREIGRWAGTGDRTIGFPSDSGRFRVRWSTQYEADRVDGRFHLTLHSGVSGRPLQEITDTRVPADGAVDVEDDPRPFDLRVEADGLAWSIVVDEIVFVRPSEAPAPATAQPGPR